MTLSVAGGVVGAKALLLGLLLLELVAGTGAAAGESVSVVFHVGRYSLGWRDVRCLGEGRHILSSRSCGGCWLVGWLINRIYLICVARCFACDECTSSIIFEMLNNIYISPDHPWRGKECSCSLRSTGTPPLHVNDAL